jgi:uncharacterized radical SAM superfamily Fe-S cluster-containing enzyme
VTVLFFTNLETQVQLTAITSSVFAKKINDQGPGKGEKGSNGPIAHKNEIIRLMHIMHDYKAYPLWTSINEGHKDRRRLVYIESHLSYS